MAKSREINMNLPSVDDLFTTQEERDQKNQEYVKDISIYEITDFPNHPFKVKMDDKMLETIESVRDHGVLVPALVREKPTGGYEMISGHRLSLIHILLARTGINPKKNSEIGELAKKVDVAIEQEKKINEDIHACKGKVTCNIGKIIEEIRNDSGE